MFDRPEAGCLDTAGSGEWERVERFCPTRDSGMNAEAQLTISGDVGVDLGDSLSRTVFEGKLNESVLPVGMPTVALWSQRRICKLAAYDPDSSSRRC